MTDQFTPAAAKRWGQIPKEAQGKILKKGSGLYFLPFGVSAQSLFRLVAKQ